MAVVFTNSNVSVGRNSPRDLSFQEIEDGWQLHKSGDPLTDHVARFADAFIHANMPKNHAYLFVRMVCAWGGLGRGHPARIRDSIFKGGRGESWLCSLLKAGRDKSIEGQYEEAIEVFSEVDGIGISFTSKILRFLCPDDAAVFDSVIRIKLGYSNSVAGYRQFVTDCKAIRDRLNATTKRPDGGDWCTTDVEMGIYKKVN